jgi:hypothetical protein
MYGKDCWQRQQQQRCRPAGPVVCLLLFVATTILSVMHAVCQLKGMARNVVLWGSAGILAGTLCCEVSVKYLLRVSASKSRGHIIV